MASSSSSLLPLLVLLLTFEPFLYVKSDENLITHLCNKTAEPVVCLGCLNSDPSSKKANAKGLALKALSCARNNTIIMFESISKLSEKIPMNSPLQTIFNDCVFNTTIVLDLYDEVTFSINEQDYATAKGITVDYVMPICNSCFDEFDRRSKVAAPLDVTSRTQAINKELKVVIGILDNI